MAKIRTVKPDLFRHPGLFEAEAKAKLPLRLAFIALFGCCDREGRFRWEPRSLKLDILPYDEVNFEQILNALWEGGYIKKYSMQNKYYGYIPSWHLHQSINKHEPPSKLPDPQQGIVEPIPSVQCIHPDVQFHALHTQTSALNTSTSAVLMPASTMPDSESQLPPIAEINIVSHMPNASLSAACDEYFSNHTDHAFDLNMHLPVSEVHMQAHAKYGELPEAHMLASLEVEMELEEEVEKELGVEIENGNKKKLGANQNIVAPARHHADINAKILTVFDCWKTVFQHPHAVLDGKRQQLIRKALQQGYTVEQLCEAISGCFHTPHNMGNNDRGQRYDGLHIILRDSDQIERFIRHHHLPPHPPDPSKKLLQANIDAGTKWLNKKHHMEKKS